jgi:hypothetical protein
MIVGAGGPVVIEPNLIANDVISMYGGEVLVRFDADQHRYLVQDREAGPDWFRAPSVTTILGRMLDKSKMLVPWSTRLSMNTFLERIEEGKAYSRGELNAIGFQIKGAHMVALEAAGKTGSAVHGWVEKYLEARRAGSGYPAPPTDPKVRSACSAARSWIQEVDLRPMAVEKILYSRMYGFIGTTDLTAAAVINGRSACCDWKSSGRLHASYGLQLAAYTLAWEEMTGTKLEDRWLIRLDKEDSTFEAKCLSAETAQDEQDAFVMLATAFKLLEGINFFAD